MATAKTTRKTTKKTTKAASTRRATPVKKTVKKRVVRKPAAAKQPGFFTFTPTVQTLYWIIIGVLVIGLTAWVMYLNDRVQKIYDEIDANSMILMERADSIKKSDVKKD